MRITTRTTGFQRILLRWILMFMLAAISTDSSDGSPRAVAGASDTSAASLQVMRTTASMAFIIRGSSRNVVASQVGGDSSVETPLKGVSTGGGIESGGSIGGIGVRSLKDMRLTSDEIGILSDLHRRSIESSSRISAAWDLITEGCARHLSSLDASSTPDGTLPEAPPPPPPPPDDDIVRSVIGDGSDVEEPSTAHFVRNRNPNLTKLCRAVAPNYFQQNKATKGKGMQLLDSRGKTQNVIPAGTILHFGKLPPGADKASVLQQIAEATGSNVLPAGTVLQFGEMPPGAEKGKNVMHIGPAAMAQQGKSKAASGLLNVEVSARAVALGGAGGGGTLGDTIEELLLRNVQEWSFVEQQLLDPTVLVQTPEILLPLQHLTSSLEMMAHYYLMRGFKARAVDALERACPLMELIPTAKSAFQSWTKALREATAKSLPLDDQTEAILNADVGTKTAQSAACFQLLTDCYLGKYDVEGAGLERAIEQAASSSSTAGGGTTTNANHKINGRNNATLVAGGTLTGTERGGSVATAFEEKKPKRRKKKGDGPPPPPQSQPPPIPSSMAVAAVSSDGFDIKGRLEYIRAPFVELLNMPHPNFGAPFNYHDTPVVISNKGTPLTVKGLSASIAAVRKGLDEALDGNTHTELDQLALRFVTVLLGKSAKVGISSSSSSSDRDSGRVKVGKRSDRDKNVENKNLESAETILRLAEMTIDQLITTDTGATRCERKQCHEYLRFMRSMLEVEQGKPITSPEAQVGISTLASGSSKKGREKKKGKPPPPRTPPPASGAIKGTEAVTPTKSNKKTLPPPQEPLNKATLAVEQTNNATATVNVAPNATAVAEARSSLPRNGVARSEDFLDKGRPSVTFVVDEMGRLSELWAAAEVKRLEDFEYSQQRLARIDDPERVEESLESVAEEMIRMEEALIGFEEYLDLATKMGIATVFDHAVTIALEPPSAAVPRSSPSSLSSGGGGSGSGGSSGSGGRRRSGGISGGGGEGGGESLSYGHSGDGLESNDDGYNNPDDLDFVSPFDRPRQNALGMLFGTSWVRACAALELDPSRATMWQVVMFASGRGIERMWNPFWAPDWFLNGYQPGVETHYAYWYEWYPLFFVLIFWRVVFFVTATEFFALLVQATWVFLVVQLTTLVQNIQREFHEAANAASASVGDGHGHDGYGGRDGGNGGGGSSGKRGHKKGGKQGRKAGSKGDNYATRQRMLQEAAAAAAAAAATTAAGGGSGGGIGSDGGAAACPPPDDRLPAYDGVAAVAYIIQSGPGVDWSPPPIRWFWLSVAAVAATNFLDPDEIPDWLQEDCQKVGNVNNVANGNNSYDDSGGVGAVDGHSLPGIGMNPGGGDASSNGGSTGDSSRGNYENVGSIGGENALASSSSGGAGNGLGALSSHDVDVSSDSVGDSGHSSDDSSSSKSSSFSCGKQGYSGKKVKNDGKNGSHVGFTGENANANSAQDAKRLAKEAREREAAKAVKARLLQAQQSRKRMETAIGDEEEKSTIERSKSVTAARKAMFERQQSGNVTNGNSLSGSSGNNNSGSSGKGGPMTPEPVDKDWQQARSSRNRDRHQQRQLEVTNGPNVGGNGQRQQQQQQQQQYQMQMQQAARARQQQQQQMQQQRVQQQQMQQHHHHLLMMQQQRQMASQQQVALRNGNVPSAGLAPPALQSRWASVLGGRHPKDGGGVGQTKMGKLQNKPLQQNSQPPQELVLVQGQRAATVNACGAGGIAMTNCNSRNGAVSNDAAPQGRFQQPQQQQQRSVSTPSMLGRQLPQQPQSQRWPTSIMPRKELHQPVPSSSSSPSLSPALRPAVASAVASASPAPSPMTASFGGGRLAVGGVELDMWADLSAELNEALLDPKTGTRSPKSAFATNLRSSSANNSSSPSSAAFLSSSSPNSTSPSTVPSSASLASANSSTSTSLSSMPSSAAVSAATSSLTTMSSSSSSSMPTSSSSASNAAPAPPSPAVSGGVGGGGGDGFTDAYFGNDAGLLGANRRQMGLNGSLFGQVSGSGVDALGGSVMPPGFDGLDQFTDAMGVGNDLLSSLGDLGDLGGVGTSSSVDGGVGSGMLGGDLFGGGQSMLGGDLFGGGQSIGASSNKGKSRRTFALADPASEEEADTPIIESQTSPSSTSTLLPLGADRNPSIGPPGLGLGENL